ncbi:MAG: hypothetical protein QOD83_4499 [Solirubrobacteraceae bacterium]|jgi:hypothetical protein|nr:hypothetical protein [Solirubrobacteraceae bacterium]
MRTASSIQMEGPRRASRARSCQSSAVSVSAKPPASRTVAVRSTVEVMEHSGRRMGTSVKMIDARYGHLAQDAEDQDRSLLDTYDAANDG